MTPKTYNTNGFTIGSGSGVANRQNDKFVAWTFRKAKKFFDVITYTGNGTAGRTVSHNLGCAVGAVWVKRYNTTNNWACWHRGIANNQYLQLNTDTQAYSDGGIFWNNTTPTSTTVTLGADSGVNGNLQSYVMYVFAHNDGDGEFGPDGDKDIIKCGTFTGSNGATINLGFEPQWILAKRTDSSTNSDWFISDVMRGWNSSTNYPRERFLHANENWMQSRDSGGSSPYSNAISWLPTSTGFKIVGFPLDSGTFTYIAIRRGPLTQPTSSSDVFAIDDGNSTTPAFNSGFPVDAALIARKDGSDKWYFTPRLRGNNYIKTDDTSAESNGPAFGGFNYQTGYYGGSLPSNYQAWMWKRAPGFFDVVVYNGSTTNPLSVTHNLGVTPELVIGRDISGGSWFVASKITSTTYHEGLLESSGNLYSQTLSSSSSEYAAFTDTTVSVRQSLNGNGATQILYLFASVDGVSKVGTFSSSYSDLVVDCGFSNGAKFVLLKRVPTGSANWDSWFVFDTTRGITTGNDNFLELDTTNAEGSDGNNIEPHNSGFKIKSGPNLNFANGHEIIFYAIAA
jgi:hypothetical protein